MTPSDIRAASTDMDKLSWQDSTGDWNFATVEECEGFFRAHYKTLNQALRFTLAAMEDVSDEISDAGLNTFIRTSDHETEINVDTIFKAMTTALLEQVRNETLTTKEN